MTTIETINEIESTFKELSQSVYDFGMWRRVATPDGYKARKKELDLMEEILNKLECLNEALD